MVQHIITAGTIDEDVMKALESKDRTQSAFEWHGGVAVPSKPNKEAVCLSGLSCISNRTVL